MSTTAVSHCEEEETSGHPQITRNSNGSIKKAPVPVPASKPAPPTAKPKAKPTPGANVNGFADGTIQGSQEEVVKSSISRDFFKKVEKKALEEEIPTNTSERRKSYCDRTSPVVLSPRKMSAPPPPTKPRTSSSSTSSDCSDIVAPPPVAIKKEPPPAPKRSGSLSENSTVAAHTPVAVSVSHLPPTHEVAEESPRLPTFKPPPPPTNEPPLDVTVEEPPLELEFELPPPELDLPPTPTVTDAPHSLDVSLPEPDFSPLSPANEFDDLSIDDNAYAPQTKQLLSDPLVLEPITLPKRKEENEFAETDDIMDQLMNDINEFTKDLDNMF